MRHLTLLVLTASMLTGCSFLTRSRPEPCRCEVAELEQVCRRELPKAQSGSRAAVLHAVKQGAQEHRACVDEAHAVAECIRGCENRD